MDRARFEELYGNYKKLMHRDPTPEEEPSIQQLTAYEELIKCGTVYADLAIFGANQQRTAKAMQGRGRIVGPHGTLILTEFKGPPDYTIWRVGWNVVVSCLIISLAVSHCLR